MPKTIVNASGKALPSVNVTKTYSKMNRRERKDAHKDTVMGMKETSHGHKLEGLTFKERQNVIKREHKNDKRELTNKQNELKRQDKVNAANTKKKIRNAKKPTKKNNKVQEYKAMTEIDTKANTKRKFVDATSKALLYGAVGTALTPAIVSIFGDDSDGTRTGTSE